jgi:two-component system sensor histidine kinase MtrB
MLVRGEDDLARLGSVVQQDGHEPAAPDPPARGPLPGPAAVRRRRVARAAHTAHDRTHGGRRHPRGPPRLRPRGGPLGRAAQAQLDRFEALLGDLLEISRFDAGAAVLETETTDLREVAQLAVDALSPLPSGAGARSSSTLPRLPAPPTSTPGASSGSCATSSSTPSSTARAGRSPSPSRRARTRWPWRCATAGRAAAGGQRPGLQPVLARRPGPGPDDRRHRSRTVHLARGRASARWLAAGVGGAGAGLAVPAHAAAPGRGRAGRLAAAAGAAGRAAPEPRSRPVPASPSSDQGGTVGRCPRLGGSHGVKGVEGRLTLTGERS